MLSVRLAASNLGTSTSAWVGTASSHGKEAVVVAARSSRRNPGSAVPRIAASRASAGGLTERRLHGAHREYALRRRPAPDAADLPLTFKGRSRLGAAVRCSGLNVRGAGHRTFGGSQPVRPLRPRHGSLDRCRPADGSRTPPCVRAGRPQPTQSGRKAPGSAVLSQSGRRRSPPARNLGPARLTEVDWKDRALRRFGLLHLCNCV